MIISLIYYVDLSKFVDSSFPTMQCSHRCRGWMFSLHRLDGYLKLWELRPLSIFHLFCYSLCMYVIILVFRNHKIIRMKWIYSDILGDPFCVVINDFSAVHKAHSFHETTNSLFTLLFLSSIYSILFIKLIR